jgi:hypothetical protein
MFSRMRSLIVLGAVTALVLTGCSAASDSPETPAGSPAPGAEAPIVDDATTAALTGEEIEAGSLSRPALSGKIDNHPSARPQVGLDEADIVFEELVEGGMTRYLAVWHSQLPAEIGPVRSVRPMDPDIVSPFGGVFAYSGGQLRFVQMMQAAPVYNAIHGQADTKSTFYRTNAKVAPHNVLVKAPELVAQHLDLPAPAPQFQYAPSLEQASAVVEGTAVAAMTTRFSGFSSPSWEWDGTQNKFLRFQTNGIADSASSGKQIAATNVIVLFVGIDVIEDIPTTRLLMGGTGYVATGGSIVEVTWTKAAPEAPIILSTVGGAKVLLSKGNTWIELVPNDSSDVDAGSVVRR